MPGDDGASPVTSPETDWRALASGATVLRAVLDQFAHNFLLNDFGVGLASGRRVTPAYSERLTIPGHEPRRRESSVERVHQARVGVRRLRSTIRTFGGLIDPEWSSAASSELAWYGEVLGAARDLDVMRAAIARSVWLVENESLRALLMGFLDQSIAEAVGRGVEERATARYSRLVEEISSIATHASFTDEADEPAREVLARHLKPTWRDAREAYHDALQRTTSRRLHRLRISLKRVQYASETVGIVEGRPAIRLARAAETLQTKLGAVHDATVASTWLADLIDVEPKLKKPLADLAQFHVTAGREARRGWREGMKRVERSWARRREQLALLEVAD
jgi:CHAD domain-containing protein